MIGKNVRKEKKIFHLQRDIGEVMINYFAKKKNERLSNGNVENN